MPLLVMQNPHISVCMIIGIEPGSLATRSNSNEVANNSPYLQQDEHNRNEQQLGAAIFVCVLCLPLPTLYLSDFYEIFLLLVTMAVGAQHNSKPNS